MDTNYNIQLVEYLINIHLMLFKKNHVVIKFHFTVFKHEIFLCVKFVFCAFCSDLKKENMRYKEDIKSEEVWKFYFLFESYVAIQIWD